MTKRSIRGLLTRKPAEKKALNPEMRKLLLSFDPLDRQQPDLDTTQRADEQEQRDKEPETARDR